VLLTPEGDLRESTLPMERPWLEDLARIARSRRGDDGAQYAAVSLGNRNYLVDFVGVSARSFDRAGHAVRSLSEDELASRIHQAVYPAMIAGWSRRRSPWRCHLASAAFRASDSHVGGANGHDRARRFHPDAGGQPQRRAARSGRVDQPE